MSYLLFLDESGYDHKSTPYDVRGGIVLHSTRLWQFVQQVKSLEVACFGDALSNFKTEIKGHKLRDKDRFKWAAQSYPMTEQDRRRQAHRFLSKGLEHRAPTKQEFTGYGQASLTMARGLFSLLQSHDAKVFAVAVPRNVTKPAGFTSEDFLRKDFVFLLERYFYFLDEHKETGLIVMDETEESQDRRFVKRLESYFLNTQTGQYRSIRIVPSPFFVSSDMAYPVQVADVCIYCVNWGFRLPNRGMDETVRQEIADEFGGWLGNLQYRSQVYDKDGGIKQTFSLVFVPDPYTSRSPD